MTTRPPSPSTPDPVSTRLEWLLEKRGLSRRALSLKAGLSAAHVGKVIDRGGSSAELDTLAKIAAAAEASLAWLVTGKGDPFEGDRPANDEAHSARLGDLDGFAEALAGAQLLRPQYQGHPVWKTIAESEPLTSGPLTPVSVAELADWMIRHGSRRRS